MKLKDINLICEECRMRINKSRTKYIVLSEKRKRASRSIGREKIEKVKNFL